VSEVATRGFLYFSAASSAFLLKSKNLFENEKCKLHALSNFRALVDVASKSGYIRKDDKERALRWSKDSENWEK